MNEHYYDIIVSPVITEKATMASEHNQVIFKVARKATKPQVKEAAGCSSVTRSRASCPRASRPPARSVARAARLPLPKRPLRRKVRDEG